MRKKLLVVAITLLALTAGGFVFVWSGLYDVAADRPHTALMYSLLNTLRERSIEVRARGIQVPPLEDLARIAEGAEHYAAMCVGCHLAPGVRDTEIRQGLLPQPPNLAEHGLHDPREAFWIIKHGIKATAMPAWGRTHDDEEIWNLVAFVRKLTTMSSEQYRAVVESDATEHTHEESGHSHEDSDAGVREHAEPSTHKHTHSATHMDGRP